MRGDDTEETKFNLWSRAGKKNSSSEAFDVYLQVCVWRGSTLVSFWVHHKHLLWGLTPNGRVGFKSIKKINKKSHLCFKATEQLLPSLLSPDTSLFLLFLLKLFSSEHQR